MQSNTETIPSLRWVMMDSSSPLRMQLLGLQGLLELVIISNHLFTQNNPPKI